MALAVEEDEPADPADVRLLGADAEVPRPNFVSDPVQQLRLGRVRLWGLPAGTMMQASESRASDTMGCDSRKRKRDRPHMTRASHSLGAGWVRKYAGNRPRGAA
jgi:hypothetical protein